DGNVTSYEYDAAGRMTLQHAPSSDPNFTTVTTHYVYDALGNRSYMTEAYGSTVARTTYYAYDALGRLTGTTLPQVGVYNYGAAPVNQNGGQIAEDGSGRHEDAQALSTSTVYDAFGQVVASVDFAGNASLCSYDKLGRADFEVDAMGDVTHYDRDVFGNAT